MDLFYRGVESSLLALSLVLGLAAAAFVTPTDPRLASADLAVTLPMISVTGGTND
ncbi:hypothetical protein [Methylobacterium organophilum]|uniref:Uncharacterized protein n=1 Tax=Methylobacterium organophilum TaxID=410 RepID=A0ABQ4TGZ9_METOR|nr:hypothetical protein [Methylobacterium organophilum]UMY18750.1 hypothetical protein MMB17_05355 [Methylobacterium organophilum]GJE29302.1 hypothetical protein LKMONMHP_4182 [Methylobacterium organophilum]